MSIHSGTTLGGRYVLRSLLAVGGMGEVWRGEDSDLGRPVAVKVLKPDAASNDTFLKRFRNEARNAAGLVHDNIAQVFDYGDQDRTAYLVMELVEGEPLSTVIEREKTLPERRIGTLLAQTARGLQVAHDAGIMHRDVKPGNLIVREGDRVKITDFGVSRSHDQTTLTQTGMVMGTAQYLAPEMALGKPATPASDLYALGIIAYECVVGKRPFTAATAVDIAIAHVNEDVPPLPDTVSPAMAELIMDLLEKNPRKRPRSAKGLAERIEALDLPDGAVPIVVPADPEPTRTPARKMPPSIAPKSFRPRPDVPRGR
ncbi:serine/threonine protein kinase [Demequina sp. B12]|uniref:serine/threonine-protein kinase n=1 Tax=Demequina sp. B12 TaxID=2992757 RepID=UPI00237A7ADE|nr:serine/threonine-protein kinase [Demequina sp. B12]MDE0572089.1 serine/threonine protein kinase [Demequina sp. B12]